MERELDWSRVQGETAREVAQDLHDLLTNIADALADPALIKMLPLPAYGVLVDMNSALVTLNRLVELNQQRPSRARLPVRTLHDSDTRV